MQGNLVKNSTNTGKNPTLLGNRTKKNAKSYYGVSGFSQILYLSLSFLVIVLFAVWWFQPQHIPKNFTGIARLYDLLLFFFVSFIIWHPIMMDVLTWVISSHITNIKRQKPVEGKKVAFITTYVPGSESIELLHNCLPAMVQAHYEHDTWLLDEGNDDEVKKICAQYGVLHFSRKDRSEFKGYAGKFTKTKGGNHNSWYVIHGNDYDFVAQIDTDFVPKKTFLTKTLGYFRDPQVAFVGTPQVYGNSKESIIARGASEQLFTFYGTVLKGLSSMKMTLLIGANHVIRVNALRSVNHYSAHITEDLLTGMKLHVLGWKSVYISEPLAVGEGPATWEAYFSQQMRWAYGCMDIFFRHSPQLFSSMGFRQSIYYFFLQQHYFSGVAMAISTLLLGLYFFMGIRTADVDLYQFVSIYSFVTITCWLASVWLQKFNVDKKDEGELLLVGKIISIAAWPVWFLAFLGIVFRRRLSYKVTPKGSTTKERVSLKIFIPHLIIGCISLGALISSFFTHRQNIGMLFWAVASGVSMLSVPFMQQISDVLTGFLTLGKKLRKGGRRIFRIWDKATLAVLFPSSTIHTEILPAPKREIVLDLLFLIGIYVSSTLLYITKLGFYSDDWAFLSNFHLASDKSLWGLIQVATTPNTSMRPVQNVYDALLFWVFGLHPLGYHIVNVGIFVAILSVFYLVLRNFYLPRVFAVTLPLLFVLLPNYATDKFWFASHQANLSVLFYLCSLYAVIQVVTQKHAKRTKWRMYSIIGMLLSILSYETILPLYLIQLLVLSFPKKLLHHSLRIRINARVFSIVLSIAILYGVFFKAMTTQRLGGITLEYITHLFTQALYVNYIQWGVKLPYIWGSILSDMHATPLMIALLGGGFIILFNYIYAVCVQGEHSLPSIRFFRNSTFLGGILFLLGYAIFITNNQVGFSPTGIANRVAIVASVGVVITFLGGIGWVTSFLFPRSIARFFFSVAVTILLIGNILITNTLAEHWIRAYEKGKIVLADVQEHIPTVAKNTTVLVDGICSYDGPAPVFEGSWDMKGALQTYYQDRTFRADIITPRITLTKRWITTTTYTFTENYPYRNLYVYNTQTKKIVPLSNSADATAYFASHNKNNGCPNAQAGEGVKIFE